MCVQLYPKYEQKGFAQIVLSGIIILTDLDYLFVRLCVPERFISRSETKGLSWDFITLIFSPVCSLANSITPAGSPPSGNMVGWKCEG